jgi:hypothetical protein
MKIFLFVEISRLTIEYTAWNLRRCNIFFTVWWNTYRKINACVRSQNDNNDNLVSTNVSISDVQLLLLDCRRKQRRSIIIIRLSSRTATLKSCVWRSSTIVTRLKDEYINWWRKRENDIISLDSQNSFYQSFPVLQMLLNLYQTTRECRHKYDLDEDCWSFSQIDLLIHSRWNIWLSEHLMFRRIVQHSFAEYWTIF